MNDPHGRSRRGIRNQRCPLTVGHELAHSYQPAMIGMGGLCVAAALVTGPFVSDDRIAGPHPAPHREPMVMP
jgi:hypothetical protein